VITSSARGTLDKQVERADSPLAEGCHRATLEDLRRLQAIQEAPDGRP
jgi:hypothetical protein